MIEYLYDAIRAMAGQEITVNAIVKDAYGTPITENCEMVLHIGDEMIKSVSEYDEVQGMWAFTYPAEATQGLEGRFEYCVMYDGEAMCFKQPIYLK